MAKLHHSVQMPWLCKQVRASLHLPESVECNGLCHSYDWAAHSVSCMQYFNILLAQWLVLAGWALQLAMSTRCGADDQQPLSAVCYWFMLWANSYVYNQQQHSTVPAAPVMDWWCPRFTAAALPCVPCIASMKTSAAGYHAGWFECMEYGTSIKRMGVYVTLIVSANLQCTPQTYCRLIRACMTLPSWMTLTDAAQCCTRYRSVLLIIDLLITCAWCVFFNLQIYFSKACMTYCYEFDDLRY